jgi:hypothetical protein
MNTAAHIKDGMGLPMSVTVSVDADCVLVQEWAANKILPVT